MNELRYVAQFAGGGLLAVIMLKMVLGYLEKKGQVTQPQQGPSSEKILNKLVDVQTAQTQILQRMDERLHETVLIVRRIDGGQSRSVSAGRAT
jgi:hypothetical protein